MATEAQLHDVAVAQLAVQGVARLGLDLAGITFLDSTGVTALLDLRKRANDRGIDMQILAVSRRAARILALVGLAETFGIPADPDTAPGQSADSDSGPTPDQPASRAAPCTSTEPFGAGRRNEPEI